MDDIYDWLSKAKRKMEESDRNAIEFFQAVLEKKPDNVEALLGVAECFLKQGDIIKAKQYYYGVLYKEPEHAVALSRIKTLIHDEIDNEEVLLSEAETYQKQGNIIKAKKCYYSVLAYDPEHAEAKAGIDRLIYNENYSDVEKRNEGTKMTSDKDFRVANWGYSKLMVTKLEGKLDFYNKPDCYFFSDKVAKLPCTVFYIFADDKLSEGMYCFNIEPSNRNKYIDEYKKLVDLLTSKYGKPTTGGKDNAIWNDDLYRNDYSNWGWAISIGHLAFISGWETHNTAIFCKLNSVNYEIKLTISYQSKVLAKTQEKNKKYNRLGGL